MKNTIHKSIKLGQTIGKYLTNSESAKDREEINYWLDEKTENKNLLETINSNMNLIQEYETMELFDDEKAAFERIKDKVAFRSKSRALVQWKIAASIAILVGMFGILHFLFGNFSKPDLQTTFYTTVQTENGQRSKVVLPDSSVVWLNSGTTLCYPDHFSRGTREVKLNGQAFFQVTHKKNNAPFSVHTSDLVIKVTGTRFDVNAYREENEFAVVLESGRVELSMPKFKSFAYVMNPGEKATINLSDNYTMGVSHVDAGIYSSWKDGKLIFRNSPMTDVVEKLKKWYDVNIEITDPEIYNSIFSGTIKNESYEEIFRLIGIACHLNCIIKHNYDNAAKPQIIISKK